MAILGQLGPGCWSLSLLAIASMATRLEAAPVEILRNGGFEAEKPGTPWVQMVSRGRGHLIVGKAQTVRPFAGERMARLGGSNREEDRLEQTILVPNGLSSLDFDLRYLVRTAGNGAGATDQLRVRLLDPDDGAVLSDILTLTNSDESTDWRASPIVSLLPWQGRLVRLSIVATTDKNKPTSFFLDELSLRYTAVDRNGSVDLAILNPRTGCLSGGGGGIAVSGILPLEARAAYSGGIERTVLELDGQVLDDSWGPGVFHLLDTSTLSPGDHTVEVTTTTRDGQVRICVARIRPTQVLINGDFEEDLAPEWTTATTSPTRLFQGAGPNPTPVFGASLLRMGEIGNVTETVGQTFRIPLDATSASLSYYYLVRTDRTGTQAVDRVDLKMQRLAGGIGPGAGAGAEWTIDSLTNLSAVPVSGDPQVGWTLVNLSIPGPVLADLVGSDVRFVLSGKNGGGKGASTFHFDAASLVAQSEALANVAPPTAFLSVDATGDLLCGTVGLTATSDRPVDELSIAMDGESSAPLDSCFGCRTLSLAWDTTAVSGCHRLWVVARTGEHVSRSDARRVSIDNVVPVCEPAAAPSAGAFTGNSQVRPPSTGSSPVPLFTGRFFVEAAAPATACLQSTSIVTSDGEVLLSSWLHQVNGWIEAGRLPTGRHRLAVRTVAVGGRETLGDFVEIDVLVETCAESTRCQNLDGYQNGENACGDADPASRQVASGNCYHLLACEASFGYREFLRDPANRSAVDIAGAHLRRAVEWAELQRLRGYQSEFDGYSGALLGSLGWELSTAYRRFGMSEAEAADAFDQICATWASGIPGCRMRLYNAIRWFVEGGEGGGRYQEREGRCGAEGNTCAEERIGYAIGSAIFDSILTPDPRSLIDRPCIYSWNDFAEATLSAASTPRTADCGDPASRLSLKSDPNIVSCSAKNWIQTWNHNEENAGYGAGILSGFAVLERAVAIRETAPGDEPPQVVGVAVEKLANWVVDKVVDQYAYKQDCWRLAGKSDGSGSFIAECCRELATGVATKCDVEWIRSDQLVADGRSCAAPSIPGVSPPASCPAGFPSGCAVPCGDFCESSSGLRQPCWSDLTSFLNRLRGEDTRHGSFVGRAAVDDDTALFYGYLANRFPIRSDAGLEREWRLCVAPRVLVLPPEVDGGSVRLSWALPRDERANGFRVYRRPDTGGPCDPRVRTDCGWDDVSGVISNLEFVDLVPGAGTWAYYVEGLLVEGCPGYNGTERVATTGVAR